MKPLTRRQRQVVQLLVNGLKAKEIARELFVEPSSVNDMVYRIRLQLEAKSLPQIVAIAMRTGQIQ